MKEEQPYSIEGLRIHVPQCTAAGIAFERLGFSVTPSSQLPGLSNRLICFAPSDARGAAFLEFLSIDDPSRASPIALNLLSAEYGPVGTLVACGDAHGFARKLDDARIEVRDIRREWSATGSTLEVVLTTLNVPRGVSPLGWAAIQFKTPEHYRIPQFIEHKNGVARFRAVLAVAETPIEVAGHFRELWGGTITTSAEFTCLRIGAGQLRIYSPQGLNDQYGIGQRYSGPHLVGVMLEVPSLQRFADTMDPSSLSFRPLARRAFIPPALACGCLLVFVPPGAIVGP